jgi:hypothetical protein
VYRHKSTPPPRERAPDPAFPPDMRQARVRGTREVQSERRIGDVGRSARHVSRLRRMST